MDQENMENFFYSISLRSFKNQEKKPLRTKNEIIYLLKVNLIKEIIWKNKVIWCVRLSANWNKIEIKFNFAHQICKFVLLTYVWKYWLICLNGTLAWFYCVLEDIICPQVCCMKSIQVVWTNILIKVHDVSF